MNAASAGRRRNGGPRRRAWAAAALAMALFASKAEAQDEFMLRGFADVGTTAFAAARSFEAILGSSRGPVVGGGVEVVLPQRVFVSLRASRFHRTGERVFLFEGQRFGLGIPVTIGVTPVELAGGYRVNLGRIVPYGGAGIGWHRYEERSEFAEPAENVSAWHRGYHVTGGVELGLVRWLAAALESQWTSVPDALGSDPNSVSHEYREGDLGGVTLRVKLVLGR